MNFDHHTKTEGPAGDPAPAAAGPALYRIPEAAIKLCISVRSVQRFIAEGELKIVKLGRSTRVTAKSIDAFIERGGTAR